MTAVAEEKDAYRASFERFAAAHAGVRARVAARAAHRRLRALRREGPAHAAGRGLAPHAASPRSRRGRFEPADPAAARPPAASRRCPREGSRGPRARLRQRAALARAVVARRRPAGRRGGEPARRCCATQPGRLEPWLGRVRGRPRPASSPTSTRPSPRTGRSCSSPPARSSRSRSSSRTSPPATARPPSPTPRTLVVAGRGSECRVVETFASPDGRASLANAVTEVVVEDDALVDRYKLQREGGEALHVATLAARLGARRALLRPLARARGGALAQRHRRPLRGRGRRVRADGLFVVDGRRVADTHSRIDHAQPHCSSRRALQGHPRRPGARRLQRPRGRAPRRAEDRRRADEPEPAALARGARALDARSSRSWPTT